MRLKLPALALSLFVCGVAAAQEAKFLGKEPYHWMDQLKSQSPRARRAGAFALGKLGTSTYAYRGIARLVERVGAQESDAEVRDAAAYALGEIALSLHEFRR